MASSVLHLPNPDVRMPEGDILALGEGDAEQPPGAVECRLYHVVERQVGLYCGVIEIGPALPELLGVITPVPGGEGKITALLRDQRLQGVAVGQRPGAGGLPDPLQQG